MATQAATWRGTDPLVPVIIKLPLPGHEVPGAASAVVTVIVEVAVLLTGGVTGFGEKL